MFIPDFVIGAVSLAIMLALLPVRVKIERVEQESELAAKPLERRLSDQRFDELLTLLAQRPAEAPHPWHNIPYDLTVVIHPEPLQENDRSKWN